MGDQVIKLYTLSCLPPCYMCVCSCLDGNEATSDFGSGGDSQRGNASAPPCQPQGDDMLVKLLQDTAGAERPDTNPNANPNEIGRAHV